MDYLEQQVKLQNSHPPTLAELHIQSMEEWIKSDRNTQATGGILTWQDSWCY